MRSTDLNLFGCQKCNVPLQITQTFQFSRRHSDICRICEILIPHQMRQFLLLCIDGLFLVLRNHGTEAMTLKLRFPSGIQYYVYYVKE